MTKEEEAFLYDLDGFIRWSIINKKDMYWVLSNLSHDINGLLQGIDYFSPRTTGYSKILVNLEK